MCLISPRPTCLRSSSTTLVMHPSASLNLYDLGSPVFSTTFRQACLFFFFVSSQHISQLLFSHAVSRSQGHRHYWVGAAGTSQVTRGFWSPCLAAPVPKLSEVSIFSDVFRTKTGAACRCWQMWSHLILLYAGQPKLNDFVLVPCCRDPYSYVHTWGPMAVFLHADNMRGWSLRVYHPTSCPRLFSKRNQAMLPGEAL